MGSGANSVASPPEQQVLMSCVMNIADDHLILGHRLSEWCGHAPTLEEDLSMPNMALDLIGQARILYAFVAELEGYGRSEDDLAYLRGDREYTNCLLAEKPNTDFAHTVLRQLYFAAYMLPFWEGVLQGNHPFLKEVAEKAVKEISYHLRHCGEWVIRLGDGTDESHKRMKSAVEELHPYALELFYVDENMQTCIASGAIPDPVTIRPIWQRTIETIFSRATLEVPSDDFVQTGGRAGFHTEDFGFLLAELQYLQRTYPGVKW